MDRPVDLYRAFRAEATARLGSRTLGHPVGARVGTRREAQPVGPAPVPGGVELVDGGSDDDDASLASR